MRATRRHLLAAAITAPLVAMADRGMRTARAAADGAVAAVRPASSGTSATRCARCGASDHAVLDARCPAAPRLRR
jgi:hypothetical protein